MAHVHNIIDADAHFIIDPITRAIKNQTQNKVRLIQGDHNCERFSFEMPKLVEGHDMTKCNLVQVHYNNIDAGTREENKGVYEIKDMQVNGNNIVFSWLITENVTKFVGAINFLIVFKCTTGEVVDYKWHTDINSEISISNGMNNTEEVTEPFPDILAQWKAELFEAGGNAVVNVSVAETNAIEAVQAEGAIQIENVKAEVEEIKADREQIYINHMSKASVIEGNAEGQSIILEDSANMPFVGLSVCGKSKQKTTTGAQLIDPTKYDFKSGDIQHGVTITINEDGSLTFSGTPDIETGYVVTVFTKNMIDDLEDGETYTTTNSFEYVENGETKYNRIIKVDKSIQTSIRSYVQRSRSIYIDGETVFHMVNKGTEVLSYEPYTGGIPSPNPEFPQEIESVENPKVNVLNKNILALEVYTNSANYASLIDVVDLRAIKKGKTYTLSVWLDSEVDSKAYWNNATKVFPYLEFEVKAGLNRYTYTFTALADGIIGEKPINVLNKFPTNDDKVIKATNAQIEEGTEATEYVAHNEQTMQIPHTLHGIPVASGGNYTDTDGQQYICNEVDFERGVFVQRLDLKTFILSKSVYEFSPLGYRYQHYAGVGFTIGNTCLCKTMSYNNEVGTDGVTTDGVRINKDAGYIIAQYTDTEGNTETIDLDILYILPEPIETPLTDEELEAYKALCTNYPNTTILNNSNAFMRVKYGIDTKMYIDKKFEELKNLILGES